MSRHLDETVLHDWLDDVLAPRDAERVERHLAECSACRDTAESMRQLVASIQALPRTVAPPASVREAIMARIDEAPAQFDVHPGDAGIQRWYDRSLLSLRIPLAAAAIVLVALTIALTSMLTGGDAPAPAQVALVDPEFAAVEAQYRQATQELETLLREVRAALPPGTSNLLDRDLSVLNAALLEAREALALDPGNPMLTSILLASYEKKLDLLRRAADAQTL